MGQKWPEVCKFLRLGGHVAEWDLTPPEGDTRQAVNRAGVFPQKCGFSRIALAPCKLQRPGTKQPYMCI